MLRGPQGTVYGRNSIGGAINYITKRPSEEQAASSDANNEFYGVVSGPLK